MYDVTVTIRVDCNGGHSRAVQLVSEAIETKHKAGQAPEDKNFYNLQIREVNAKQAKA